MPTVADRFILESLTDEEGSIGRQVQGWIGSLPAFVRRDALARTVEVEDFFIEVIWLECFKDFFSVAGKSEEDIVEEADWQFSRSL